MWQMPWLFLYTVYASFAVLQFGLAVEYISKGNSSEFAYTLLLNSIVDFLFGHATLILTSTIHHVPTKSPHNLMLYLLRFVILGFTITIICNCVKLTQGNAPVGRVEFIRQLTT